ncbi:MAG: RidA family protein, partial [Pseudolabrys sp.]
MKATPINPAILLTPAGPYAQGIKIEAPTQWFVSTGQVAITADGSIVEGATEQSELVWKHLQALLSDAGMTLANVVKTNVYAVSADVLAAH